MKLMALSDIHQMSSKWKLLVKEAKEKKPDVVAIAGDILPKDRGIPEQLNFRDSLFKYAQALKDAGIELVLTLGNDDNQLFIPYMREGQEKGLWHYLENNSCEIAGYTFVGMPYVPDHPFGYKYWVRSESRGNTRIDPQQFSEPLEMSSHNEFRLIPDYKKWLENQESIQDILIRLSVETAALAKSIWLIHAPPSELGLDVCSHGQRVGSDAVLQFIKVSQPMLTIHGHIHESPEYTKIWQNQVGRSICVQAGQLGVKLYYTMITIDGGVKDITHSVYGQG